MFRIDLEEPLICEVGVERVGIEVARVRREERVMLFMRRMMRRVPIMH